ncbi:fungal-specific transcription factor domain-containing protein [Dipodascopsis tothii]|uniref:fungal-specific transcription factor domain-containing protein n=1 Tax=Dipodascopsis tothii TaxID=44089 RepID=UPI0034CE2F12
MSEPSSQAASEKLNVKPKRQRTVRACVSCRKRKIKCDGRHPCLICYNANRNCVFTATEAKAKQPKRARYIESLEARLDQLESFVNSVIPENSVETLSDPQWSQTNITDRKTKSTRAAGHETRGRSFEESESTLQLNPHKTMAEKEEDLSFVYKNSNGGDTYIGFSSPWSFFSKAGIHWVREKTGSEDFEGRLKAVSECDAGILCNSELSRLYLDINDPPGRTFAEHALPSLDTVHQCIDVYERLLHPVMPIFDVAELHVISSRVYESNSNHSSLDYFVLNAFLSATFMYSNCETDQQGLPSKFILGHGFFKNALNYFPAICRTSEQLLAVRGLLALSAFTHGIGCADMAGVLITTAIRFSQALGLHRQRREWASSAKDHIGRNRIWWLCYYFDMEMSIRNGRPAMIKDEEMTVAMPVEKDGLVTITSTSGEVISIFYMVICLSRIQSKILNNLYSFRPEESRTLYEITSELDRELMEWYQKIPAELLPLHTQGDLILKSEVTENIMVQLLVNYYNCFIAIHRYIVYCQEIQEHDSKETRPSKASGQNSKATKESMDQNRGSGQGCPNMSRSFAVCLRSSRAILALVPVLENDKSFLIRLFLLYHFVSSMMVLFGFCLSSPKNPSAYSDLRMMSNVVQYINAINAKTKVLGLERAKLVAELLYMVAKKAVNGENRSLLNLGKVESDVVSITKGREITTSPIELALRNGKLTATNESHVQHTSAGSSSSTTADSLERPDVQNIESLNSALSAFQSDTSWHTHTYETAGPTLLDDSSSMQAPTSCLSAEDIFFQQYEDVLTFPPIDFISGYSSWNRLEGDPTS